jgi:hypothetical protein
MGVALLMLTLLSLEDPPPDVVDFFRSAATALADAHRDRDAGAFLDHFDKSMPGYAEFSDRIRAMLAEGEVNMAIDFVNQKGDDKKRTLDLDWLLQIEGERPKRAVLQCTIEKRGKKWKITALAPLEFFKRE